MEIKIKAPIPGEPVPIQDQKSTPKITPEQILAKIKPKASFFKNPKFLIFAILLITSILVILALNLMSLKKEDEVIAPPPQTLESPKTSPDPTKEEIIELVDAYSQKIDNLKNFQKELVYPIVDLDINFEE